MEFAQFPYLTAILLSCAAGLLIILFVPGQQEKAIKWISVVFSGIPLALSIYLYCAYDQGRGGYQFVEKIAWIPSMGVHYFNAADGFNLPMLLLTGLVFFTAVLSMWELQVRVKEFFALTFLLVTGGFGLFMSLDLFFLFVWFDVSLFPMYLLIAVWGSTNKEYGALKLTLYLLAGSALILPGLIYLYVASGLNTFDILALSQPGTFTPFQQRFAFLLFYIGFGILAGVWPFHTWSPPGHVSAPTAVSMIHAGVLMKIGAFGILRVGLFLCPDGWQYWAQLMALLAAIGIVYGVNDFLLRNFNYHRVELIFHAKIHRFVEPTDISGIAMDSLRVCVPGGKLSHLGVVGPDVDRDGLGQIPPDAFVVAELLRQPAEAEAESQLPGGEHA